MTTPRYAIYFAPDQTTKLWKTGCRWLGRDAVTGCLLSRSGSAAVDSMNVEAITAIPSHYGFHATLKPPFHLSDGRRRDDLLAFAASFARRTRAITLPALQVSPLGKFIALIPNTDHEEVKKLARACVVDFDPFRAPQTANDLARRQQASLTPRQSELLRRWGYPYVLDEFRFHLTLTGPLKTSERTILIEYLMAYFAKALAVPCPIDAVSVFAQDTRESSFYLVERFALTGS